MSTTITGQPAEEPAALHRAGLVARENGQLQEALELITRSLQLNDRNILAICDLADILQRMGRPEESIEFYRAAADADPRNASIHTNLGCALSTAGHLKEALQCHRRAIKLDPKFGPGHGNLGVVYQAMGEFSQALASYRQAKKFSPDSEPIMSNLGACLLQLGRQEEALEVLSRGVVKHPRSLNAFSNLCAAYVSVNRPEEAIQAARSALEINPNSSSTLNNLGNALKAKGDYNQAIACYAKARQIEPNCHLAYNNLGSTLSEMGRSTEALEALRRALELRPESAVMFSNYLLTLNYLPDVSRDTLFTEHKRFDTQFGAPLAQLAVPHKNRPDPERRLRIGYVSADLRDHPVANFVEPILAEHSAADFEVFCYANQRVSDSVTERLRSYTDRWRSVAGLTDAELAVQIRQDKIDILVDLSGHTAGNRLLAFARKPAPVQVSAIGYMQTTGLSAMDYRITDRHLDPVGSSEPYSSETLVRLVRGAADFRPPAESPDVNELPALQNGYITFGSFNNLAKITPEVIGAWVQILKATPNSRLLVVGRAGSAIQDKLLAAGIAQERLELIERLPMQDYLKLHNRVDILLDTFPYNGGTTTLIAVWMGVPFITLSGTSAVSRAGTHLLRAMNLLELSAADVAQYVQRAVAIEGDLPKLAHWRRELRGRLAPMLGQGTGHTRELEGAYRKMWRNWCAQAVPGQAASVK